MWEREGEGVRKKVRKREGEKERERVRDISLANTVNIRDYTMARGLISKAHIHFVKAHCP